MSQSNKTVEASGRKEWLKVWAIPLAIVALGFVFAIAGIDPPPPDTLRFANGRPGGAYHGAAVQYREILAKQGFKVELVETAGSMENLELLRRGEVDIAFVQGGTAKLPADGDSMQALASVFFEPLWIFQRSSEAVDQLRKLEGRRLVIGDSGSGTLELALQLLEANGIDSQRAELIEAASQEAVALLLADEADAAFLVTTGGSRALRQLLASPDISLMSFDRHLAYTNRFRFLSPVVLGQGAVDLAADLPAQDHTLLASATQLVAGRDLHHALVPLLLETALQVHSDGQTFEEERQLPTADFTDLPMGKDATHYLEYGPSFLHSYLGFWAASTVDRLKILLLPLITLLIPVFKAAPPIYRWRIRSRIYRWYEDLKLVDDVLAQEVAPQTLAQHIHRLKKMENELTEIQVPLSYMDEFYRLRVHIQLILAKLEGRLPEKPGQSPK